MLIVFHTMCEKSEKIYKGLFPNFGLAWCPPNKNHLPTPMNHSDEDENEETTAQTGSQNIESFIVQEF